MQPLDIDTVVASVQQTNRAVVVHEAVRFGGLGAEIAAQIQEQAFDYLDAPVGRVGAPFSPVPFSPALESHYVPDADAIAAGIRDVLARPLLAPDRVTVATVGIIVNPPPARTSGAWSRPPATPQTRPRSASSAATSSPPSRPAPTGARRPADTAGSPSAPWPASTAAST